MPTGKNIIFFIPHSAVPTTKKVTYGRLVSSIRPQKTETHRVHLTVGDDHLTYLCDAPSSCAAITTVKLLLNSTISTPNGRVGCIDIKDFYYGTPLTNFE